MPNVEGIFSHRYSVCERRLEYGVHLDLISAVSLARLEQLSWLRSPH